MKGLSIGLFVQSVGLYYFDYMASTRGAVYLEFLKSFYNSWEQYNFFDFTVPLKLS